MYRPQNEYNARHKNIKCSLEIVIFRLTELGFLIFVLNVVGKAHTTCYHSLRRKQYAVLHTFLFIVSVCMYVYMLS